MQTNNIKLTWCGLAVSLLLLAGGPASRAADAETDELAEIGLKKLKDAINDASGDREQLRNKILAYRIKFPGTPQAMRAAGLLAQLPDTLDKLDPKVIPEVEKFSWQPRELVAILGEHKGRHAGPVSCVGFSPDGKLLASGGSGLLRLWDPTTMRLQFVTGNYYAHALAWSKDSKILVTSNANATVNVYDVTEGDKPTLQLRYGLSAGTADVYGVTISPDTKRVAAACFDNHIRIYDITEKKAKDPVIVQGHEKAVTCVAYSPDGKTLASGSADLTARLWDATLEIPKEKAVLSGHSKDLTALAFSPTGSTLATACNDGTIRLWSIPPSSKPKERVTFGTKDSGKIYSLAYSNTGRTLAVACADKLVHWWNVTVAKPVEIGKLDGHVEAVTSVAYSPDNKMMATGSTDWTCRTWDITGKAKERFTPWSHLSHTYSTDISPDCQTLASGSYDRVLRLWDTVSMDPKKSKFLKPDQPFIIFRVLFAPDGQRLAVSGQSTTIKQWDPHKGRPLANCLGMPSYPSSLFYSPDSKWLVAHYDKMVYQFDAQSGVEISDRRLTGHQTPILSIDLAPDGKHIVTGSGAAQLDKDGKVVVKDGMTVYIDLTLRIWDTEKGAEMHSLKPHKLPVYRAFFSPDSKYIYSGTNEGSLLRREVNEPLKSEAPAFPGVSPYYYTFQFSPDGEKVATVYGGRLVIYEAAKWKPLVDASLGENIGSATWASDSRHLSVSLATGVVYVLRVSSPTAK
jgi:WD40 repeat protein